MAALDLLRHSYPGAKLLFVGDGPLQDTLVHRVRQAGLEDHVRFIGHIHPVQPVYEAIDVLVSPSDTEGISNVILEAMALRKLVVATAVGGTPRDPH